MTIVEEFQQSHGRIHDHSGVQQRSAHLVLQNISTSSIYLPRLRDSRILTTFVKALHDSYTSASMDQFIMSKVVINGAHYSINPLS